MRMVEPLSELLLELVPCLRAEFAPYFSAEFKEPQLIGHEARSW